MNNLDSCLKCVSRLADIDVPETCPEIFQNRLITNSLKYFETIVDELRKNLNIENLELSLSPPVANMSKYVARVENYTVVRTNDPIFTSNLRLKRYVGRIIDSIIPQIHLRVC